MVYLLFVITQNEWNCYDRDPPYLENLEISLTFPGLKNASNFRMSFYKKVTFSSLFSTQILSFETKNDLEFHPFYLEFHITREVGTLYEKDDWHDCSDNKITVMAFVPYICSIAC